MAEMVAVTAEHFEFLISLARFGADRTVASRMRNGQLDTVVKNAIHIDHETADEGVTDMSNGQTPKVKTATGKSQTSGTVSFKSGAKPGPVGSGAARNARFAARKTS